jgi:hypothetical protein
MSSRGEEFDECLRDGLVVAGGGATLKILRRRHVQPIVSAPNRNDFVVDFRAPNTVFLRFPIFIGEFSCGPITYL